MPPIFYGTYKVGSWLLGTPAIEMPEKITASWVFEVLMTHWQPLYLGSFVCGVILAILGFSFTLLYWRWWVSRSWNRRLRRQKKQRELRELLAAKAEESSKP